MDCFIKAPNNTLAYHIYHRLRDPNNPCYMIDGNEFLKFDPTEMIKQRFLVGPSINVERITAIVHNMFERNVFFNDKSFFKTLRVFYLSNKLAKEKKDFIDLCISTLFTHGFILELVRDVRSVL